MRDRGCLRRAAALPAVPRPVLRDDEDDDVAMRQRFTDALTDHLATCAPQEAKSRAATWAKEYFKAQVAMGVAQLAGRRWNQPTTHHPLVWGGGPDMGVGLEREAA